MKRRDLLQGLLAAPLGACCLRQYARPSIESEMPSGLRPILQPGRIHKAAGAPAFCVDVHAHFFNAADVPVRGFIEGPVAHSLGEPLGNLVRKLAPMADALAALAPDAPLEYRRLIELAGGDPGGASARVSAADLDRLRDDHRDAVSESAYGILRGSAFEAQFNALQDANQRSRSGILPFERHRFGPRSIARAMRVRTPAERSELQALLPRAAQPPYWAGVLEFVGRMLSYRWMNLRDYQQAYSTRDEAFGIDQVFGALVDFDRWLQCPPRSSHEDQVRVHELLATLSGGYFRPLVAYNPWTDLAEDGRSLARVEDAVSQRGFVGVKIYPPMGFRPLGNHAARAREDEGPPSAQALDGVLREFWRTCAQLDVPVMAHTGQSMGKDDAHDELGGPAGWRALLDAQPGGVPPRVNAGHFGGDEADNDWSLQLAALMQQPAGAHVYGDLGYWNALGCSDGSSACAAATRLERVLDAHPIAAQRILYGSDWLMLSRERDWAGYPARIAQHAPARLDRDALFGGNAKASFPRAFP